MTAWQRFDQRYGAHPGVCQKKKGVWFSLFAPEAEQVMLVGDFNFWDSTTHPMEKAKDGSWRLFVPCLQAGERYQYDLLTKAGVWQRKTDPCGYWADLRPENASRVWDHSTYAWQDDSYLAKRRTLPHFSRPILIYELHAASWQRHEDNRFLSWQELADRLIPYVQEMGYTHIELLPVMEHPLDSSWGYQITGYYSATSRFGDPDGLKYLVDRCHQADIGVLLDWVPGHFCKDEHGLSHFDGSQLFEKEEHCQWGTLKFDFSREMVCDFLWSNALFWLEEYHADGLRVDGVSSMLYLNYGRSEGDLRNALGGDGDLDAIAFLRELNRRVLTAHPDVLMIAEESTAWPLVTYPPDQGGLGFHYKWNMGWMNDTLRYMETPFSWRRDQHRLLNFSMTYAFSENYVLPLSHDEVVHGKRSLLGRMPGDYDQQFAGLRLLLMWQYCHPGIKLDFMGTELGQFIEWQDHAPLDWCLLAYPRHQEIQEFCRVLNGVYRENPPLWQDDHSWEGFHWLDADDNAQSILMGWRKGEGPQSYVLFVLNFQPTAYDDFRIGVPGFGYYYEILNSDGLPFGGAGEVNEGRLPCKPIGSHGQRYSISLRLPALSGVLIRGKVRRGRSKSGKRRAHETSLVCK